MGNINVFDEDWNYVAKKSSFTNVTNIIPVDNYLYITGLSNIWKTDQELNVLIQCNSTATSYGYRGLYYNSTNYLIYVAPTYLNIIDVFNKNLTLNDTFSTASYYPWSINEHNNELYVGTRNGTMLVIVNKIIINQFYGCNRQSVILLSILFDDLNNMATSCNHNQLYLYNTTGTYLNKSIRTVFNPLNFGLDSKGSLVVITWAQISLYN